MLGAVFTHRALEGPKLGMRLHVNLNVPLLGATVTADRAGERLLSRVCPDMLH